MFKLLKFSIIIYVDFRVFCFATFTDTCIFFPYQSPLSCLFSRELYRHNFIHFPLQNLITYFDYRKLGGKSTVYQFTLKKNEFTQDIIFYIQTSWVKWPLCNQYNVYVNI